MQLLTIFRFKRAWLALLAAPAWILTALAAANPSETERIYSTGVYPVLAGGVASGLAGLVPFSLAEILLVAFAIGLAVHIIKSVARKRFAACAATLLCCGGVIWFGFVALCGLNYHRETFAQNSGLEIRPSSAEELARFCADLGGVTSSLAAGVARDEYGVMLKTDAYGMAKLAPAAYGALGQVRPEFSGFCATPKPVLASVALSLADIVGVYFPFTFEANVNQDVAAYVIPSSMTHELAHFKGYMREDEANFIAYLACMASDDTGFRYSGAMLALRHSLNALYSADREAYAGVVAALAPEVLADYAANDAYWRRFEGPIAEVAQTVNDVYLKTNRQEAGVKSYGQMVDLLLADYRGRV